MDRLSVVAPAFDEERRLPALLARVGEHWLADTPIVLHELIVVDDGSSDGTGRMLEAAAAQEPRLRVLRLAPARARVRR